MDSKKLNREDIITRRGYRKDIQGDAFALFISNYPGTSQYLAERLGNKSLVLLELCCSVGVTLEHLSRSFKKVIGVEIDPVIASLCKSNLTAAGITNAEVICSDANDISLLKRISADVVIYDIPYWYGIQEANSKFANPPLDEVMDKIRTHVSDDIVIFAPTNMDEAYFLHKEVDCEYEAVYINGRHDRNHIYFGRLARKKGKTEMRIIM